MTDGWTRFECSLCREPLVVSIDSKGRASKPECPECNAKRNAPPPTATDFQTRRFPLRRLLLFVFSYAMLVVGLYWTIGGLRWLPLLGGSLPLKLMFLVLLAGIFPVLLGAYVLWVDFIAPAFGVKTGESAKEHGTLSAMIALLLTPVVNQK